MSKFCKICRDSGKSKVEYTSHYVKDKKGIIICPILKNNICRYCKKNGHTIKYCEILKNKKNLKHNNKKIKYIINDDGWTTTLHKFKGLSKKKSYYNTLVLNSDSDSDSNSDSENNMNNYEHVNVKNIENNMNYFNNEEIITVNHSGWYIGLWADQMDAINE